MTVVSNPTFSLFPRPYLSGQSGYGVCPLFLQRGNRIPRLSLVLANLCRGFPIANVNFVLRRQEHVPFLFEGLLSIRRRFRVGLIGFEVPARGELLRHLERLHRS